MKKITILLLLVFLICIAKGYAQEVEQVPSPDEQQIETAQTEHYVFPVIQPEISITGGYRDVHLNGSSQAMEYEYLHDSLVLGGELRSVSLNHRLHLDLDVKNEKDYYGDISYAYKDLILFRGVNSTLFHNLDNIELQSLAPGDIDRRDVHQEYGLQVGISNLLLRVKAPDFPAHIFLDSRFVDKSGDVQQRFLGGNAYFTNRIRVSQSRQNDWDVSEYTIGVNSHLGYVEAEVSHTEKRFDVSGDNALKYNYAEAPGREAGVYLHNLVPEMKSSTNTLKLHTNYTGQIVAAATLSKTDKENRYSGATEDFFFGSGEVTWMPAPKLTFFLNYRYKDNDPDNPDSVSIRNLTTRKVYIYDAANNLKPAYSISTTSHMIRGMARYRIIPAITLRAEYSYEDISRGNASEWNEPDSSQVNTLALSADMRVFKNIKFKVTYNHDDINNPALNTVPDKSDEGIATLSWTPLSGLTTFLHYSIRKENRDQVNYLYALGTPSVEYVLNLDNREVRNEQIMGTVTYTLLRNVSLAASYAYIHYKVEQDIAYNDTAGVPNPDLMVPYKNFAQTYSFNVTYAPKQNVTFDAGVVHTTTKGDFYPSSVLGQQHINDFSKLKLRETLYSAAGEYRFKDGFTAGIQYRYSTLNDLLDNPYDDVSDGRASIVLLTLSKKW